MKIEFENDFELKCFFDNIEDFYKYIQYSYYDDPENNTNFLGDCIFRGVGSSSFTLTPNILRNIPSNFLFSDQLLKETSYLHLFYKYCNENGLHIPCNINISDIYFTDLTDANRWISSIDNVWPSKEILDLMALAQHYHLPTRFLDWSQDVYISMYFATHSALNESKKENNSGYFSLWAFNIKKFQIINNSLKKNKIPMEVFIPAYDKNQNTKAQKGVLTTWILNLRNIYQLGKFSDPYPEEDRDTEKFLLYFLEGISPREHVGKILFKFTFPYTEIFKSLKILEDSNYYTSRIYPSYDGVVQQILEKPIEVISHETNTTFQLT